MLNSVNDVLSAETSASTDMVVHVSTPADNPTENPPEVVWGDAAAGPDRMADFHTIRDASTSVGDGKPVDEATLEACSKLIRDQFDSDLVSEANAYNSAEERQAKLLTMGYLNALDWLSNRKVLNAALVKIKLTPAGDVHGLLGQIAQLQMGSWKVTEKATVWKVPSRRDQRQARFYRIFNSNEAKFPVDDLYRTIMGWKKRSGGILEDFKAKKVTISDAERNHNRKQALLAKPLAKASAPDVEWGNAGDYMLVLVRAAGDGIEIVQRIEKQDALTARLADEYMASAARTVKSNAQG